MLRFIWRDVNCPDYELHFDHENLHEGLEALNTYLRAVDEEGKELLEVDGIPGKWITLKGGQRVFIRVKYVNEGVPPDEARSARGAYESLPEAIRGEIGVFRVGKSSIWEKIPIINTFTNCRLLGLFEPHKGQVTVWTSRAKNWEQSIPGVVNHEGAHALFSRSRTRSAREQSLMDNFLQSTKKEHGVSAYAESYRAWSDAYKGHKEYGGIADHFYATENFAETYRIYRERDSKTRATWNNIVKTKPETTKNFYAYLDFHGAR